MGLYIKDVDIPTVFECDLVLRVKPDGSVIATNDGMVGAIYTTAVPFDEEKIVRATELISEQHDIELRLKELKAEAKKHGYHLIKDPEKVYLLPCVCGCNRREKWYGAYGIKLKCKECWRSATGDTELKAKKQWNRMVKEEMELMNNDGYNLRSEDERNEKVDSLI